MINRFCTSALWECNKTLIAVAQGNLPADLVVRHARLVSTPTREVVDDVDIAIACGRIAYVGLDGNTAEHCVGTGTQVIDARGRYTAPGFIDSHIHLESSMLTPSEFARGAAARNERRHVGPARDSQRGRACGGARDGARRAAHPA